MSTTTDHRMTAPDVMGRHEFRAFLRITWPDFNNLRKTDPAFPLAKHLECGPVWAGAAVRKYDTARRNFGVYTP